MVTSTSSGGEGPLKGSVHGGGWEHGVDCMGMSVRAFLESARRSGGGK